MPTGGLSPSGPADDFRRGEYNAGKRLAVTGPAVGRTVSRWPRGNQTMNQATIIETLPCWIAPRWDAANGDWDFEWWDIYHADHQSLPKHYRARMHLDDLDIIGINTPRRTLEEAWRSHVDITFRRGLPTGYPVHVSDLIEP